MIEALFSLLFVVERAAVAFVSFIVDAIAGLFVAAGQTLTAVDLFIVLFVLVAECCAWLLLMLFALVRALVLGQKPVLMSKPVFWRPKAKLK